MFDRMHLIKLVIHGSELTVNGFVVVCSNFNLSSLYRPAQKVLHMIAGLDSV